MYDEKILTLYNSIIQNHSRTPQNQSPINVITHQAIAINKFCGDEVQLNLKYNQNNFNISDIQLIAKGCSISIASSSIVSTLIIGLSSRKINLTRQIFQKMLDNQNITDTEIRVLGDLIYFQPLSQIQIRKKCSLLIWKSIENIKPLNPLEI
ncbi:MAG: Fe-S cluster assembly sulfur transfer protein SufU [Dehalococcoidia bacterium]